MRSIRFQPGVIIGSYAAADIIPIIAREPAGIGHVAQLVAIIDVGRDPRRRIASTHSHSPRQIANTVVKIVDCRRNGTAVKSSKGRTLLVGQAPTSIISVIDLIAGTFGLADNLAEAIVQIVDRCTNAAGAARAVMDQHSGARFTRTVAVAVVNEGCGAVIYGISNNRWNCPYNGCDGLVCAALFGQHIAFAIINPCGEITIGISLRCLAAQFVIVTEGRAAICIVQFYDIAVGIILVSGRQAGSLLHIIGTVEYIAIYANDRAGQHSVDIVVSEHCFAVSAARCTGCLRLGTALGRKADQRAIHPDGGHIAVRVVTICAIRTERVDLDDLAVQIIIEENRASARRIDGLG